MKKRMKNLFCAAAAFSLTYSAAFPVTAVMQPEAEAGTADTVQITDPETIGKMFTRLITENNLNAKVVNNAAYPGYMQPVIVEFTAAEGVTPANVIIVDFAETYHIDRRVFTVIPVVNGNPFTTANAMAPQTLWGDTDCSGSIDIADAVLTARFVAEDTEAGVTDQGRKNADVNSDGSITLDDTALILRRIAKQI